MAGAKSKWIRPLGPIEEADDDKNDEGWMNVSYCLRLESCRILETEEVLEAINITARTLPNLRMCVLKRDGVKWYSELDEPNIDFGVIEDAEPFKVYHNMPYYRRSEKGLPPWAFRFLPWSPKQSEFVHRTSLDNCISFKDGKICMPEEYPEGQTVPGYLSHVVMTFNHAIMDGHTAHEIMRVFLEVLGKILAGEVAEFKDIKYEFLHSSFVDAIYKEIEGEFENKTRNFEERFTFLNNFKIKSLLPQAYPIPVDIPSGFVCLCYNLDEPTTTAFRKKCKSEGVTFHSGYTAALDAAYSKLLLDAGVSEDNYTIGVVHCANQRSYVKNSNHLLGKGMGLMLTHSDFSRSLLDGSRLKLWDYARNIHAQLKGLRSSKDCFENIVVGVKQKLDLEEIYDESQVTKSSLPPMMTYSTSNMVDVTNKLENSKYKDYVQLKWYDRLSTVDKMPMHFYLVCQTFNGRFMQSFQYNQHFISAQTSEMMCKNIFEMMGQMCLSDQ